MGGSSTSSNKSSFTMGHESTAPWAYQQPYILNAFNRAEGAYQNAANMGPYKGEFIAEGDAKNNAAFQQAYDFGMDPRNNQYVQDLFSSANNWLNQGTGYFNKGAQGLSELAGDQTQNIIGSAKQMADNSYISDAVKAATFDAYRGAAEHTIPNLYRAGSVSGNLNSDRAALAQGLVERGLAEQGQNLSAKMRYDAYTGGLDRASSEVNSRRGAFGTLGNMGLSAGQLGGQGLTSAIDDQSRLNQMSAAGAEGLRSLRQVSLDNAKAKWDEKQNFPYRNLQNYYGIIGDKSWGGERDYWQMGQEQSNEKKSGGLMSSIGSGLGALGGLFSGGSSSAMSGLFSFLSEDTEKTDVKRVGKTPEGLPLYAYRYKGDPKSYPKVVGPMASEVQKKYPDAVKQIEGGPRIVDYYKAINGSGWGNK